MIDVVRRSKAVQYGDTSGDINNKIGMNAPAVRAPLSVVLPIKESWDRRRCSFLYITRKFEKAINQSV